MGTIVPGTPIAAPEWLVDRARGVVFKTVTYHQAPPLMSGVNQAWPSSTKRTKNWYLPGAILGIFMLK